MAKVSYEQVETPAKQGDLVKWKDRIYILAWAPPRESPLSLRLVCLQSGTTYAVDSAIHGSLVLLNIEVTLSND